MARIFHIEASPRGNRSGSSQLASWFLDAYAWQTTQPSAEARADYLASFREECETLGAAF